MEYGILGGKRMLEAEIHNCFLCGSELDKNKIVYKKVPSKKYKQLFDKKGKEIHTTSVICECGLTQVLDTMTEESLNKYYKCPDEGLSEYRKMFTFNPNQAYEHLLNTLKFVHVCMGRDTVMTNSRNWLELGGANIQSWDTVKNVFPFIDNVYSYDPGIPVKHERVLDDLGVMNFDIITIINTMEHMFNPKEVLLSLRDNINADGRIIICVPNLINSSLHTTMDAWFSAAHVYHFEIDSLMTLIKSCGYVPMFCMVSTEGIGEKIYISIAKVPEIPSAKIEVKDDEYLNKRIEYVQALTKVQKLKEDILNGTVK
jgi:Methyltransferase domain